MRIGITNTVLSNTGDAAICLSIIDILEKAYPAADLSFTIFDSDARSTRKLYPQLDVAQQLSVQPPFRPGRIWKRISQLRLAVISGMNHSASLVRMMSGAAALLFGKEFRRVFSTMRELDLVISSGGTYLVDHYDFTARVVELEFVRSTGTPVVLWTQSMGPFRTTKAYNNASRIKSVTDAVFFRDHRSERAWETLPPSGSQESAVVADSVFGLDLAKVPHSTLDRSQPSPVLISVRRWWQTLAGEPSDLPNYRSALQGLAKDLCERGRPALALSTCQGVPSYAYDDSKIARSFFAETSVEVDGDFHNPYQLLSILSSASGVVATRMHFSILAMLAKRPVIAIAYETKSVDLFASIDARQQCVAIDEVAAEWLTQQVNRALEKPESMVIPEKTIATLAASAAIPAGTKVITEAVSSAPSIAKRREGSK